MRHLILKLQAFIIVCPLLYCCNNTTKTGANVNIREESSTNPELIVFESPKGAPLNSTYSVFAKCEGGKWVDLHEYDAEIDGGYMKEPIHHMAFVSFDSDFSSKIDIKVIKKSGEINDAKIQPELSDIHPEIDGNVIMFSITKPGKFLVEINGDLHNNLMVFANKPEKRTTNPTGDHVIYFGPGIHKIGGDGQGTLHLKSNDKVYIAGGAIVYGTISASGANNISVTGRGILCGGMYTNHAFPHPGAKGLILFSDVENAKIEGITLLNTVGWNIHLYSCDGVLCSNLKIMGWTINSDGINPQCSRNVVIDDCFVRNFDDCISIKMNYGKGEGGKNRTSHNITVQNCTFWTDQGRAVLIGPESYIPGGGTFEDIMVRNIDVLYNMNYDVDWAKGVLAINLGDSAIAQNIVFEDIRIHRIGPKTNLFTLTMDKYTYNVSEGKHMENIYFNRVSLDTEQNLNNYIYGYDSSRMIEDIYFNDLKINGSYIKNSGGGRFDINKYAKNVAFIITNK